VKHTPTSRLLAGSTALAGLAAVAAAQRPEAVCGAIKADVNDPVAMLAQVNAAFKEYKDTIDVQLKSKVDDVVVTEKLDKIDAALANYQGIIDGLNARITAGGGDDPEVSADERAYAEHFRGYFAGGDHEGELRAAQKVGVRAALSEGVPANGGYTVPVEWDRTIVDRLKLVSPIRSISQVVNTTKRGWTKLLNDRNIGSGWVGETAARPETATPGLYPLAFGVGTIYANPAATQDLLDDSEINIEEWLASEVETEFSRQEGIAFVSGNGTNKPQGLLTYVDNTVHPWGPVATVNSGNASATTADGIISLTNDLPSAYIPDARFIANRKTIGAHRKLKDGQGNYIWQPSFALGQPQTLAGYPITEVPDMPDIAANAVPIMFGDFKRGYLVIDRMGVRVLRDPYTNKPYVTFYTTKRVGGGIQNPDVLRYYKIAA